LGNDEETRFTPPSQSSLHSLRAPLRHPQGVRTRGNKTYRSLLFEVELANR
jgi:hypothetical protein